MSVGYLLALHSVCSLQGKRLFSLIDYFGDAEECWNNENCWQEALQVNNNAMKEILQEKHDINPEAVYERFLKSGARFVTVADENYPAKLRNIANPPYLLYYKGSLPQDDDVGIAMIGSRRATAYGLQAAEHISRQLAQQKVTVVSGLARGIDSAGHKGCIAGGGRTIGVLGCGIDVVYPRENGKLFKQVEENGCIISEFPFGMKPLPVNFVMRNRLVSGLADGVVVVEATRKSGTQITVDYALEQGKAVFAVPGPIFSPMSQGTHSLIRDDNIKLVTCADDIMEDIFSPVVRGGEQVQIKLYGDEPLGLNGLEKQIWDYLVTAKHFNEIVEFTNKNAAEIAPVLTVMEVRGFVCRQDGQYYIRKNV